MKRNASGESSMFKRIKRMFRTAEEEPTAAERQFDENCAAYSQFIKNFGPRVDSLEANKAQLEADKAQLEADKAQLEADKAQLEANKAQLEADHAKKDTQLKDANELARVVTRHSERLIAQCRARLSLANEHNSLCFAEIEALKAELKNAHKFGPQFMNEVAPAEVYSKESVNAECAICMETFIVGSSIVRRLNCGHAYCPECIDTAAQKATTAEPTCSVCRAPLARGSES